MIQTTTGLRPEQEAQDHRTTDKRLRELALYPDTSIRLLVAKNAATPPSVLSELLTRDSDENVRWAAKGNMRDRRGNMR